MKIWYFYLNIYRKTGDFISSIYSIAKVIFMWELLVTFRRRCPDAEKKDTSHIVHSTSYKMCPEIRS